MGQQCQEKTVKLYMPRSTGYLVFCTYSTCFVSLFWWSISIFFDDSILSDNDSKTLKLHFCVKNCFANRKIKLFLIRPESFVSNFSSLWSYSPKKSTVLIIFLIIHHKNVNKLYTYGTITRGCKTDVAIFNFFVFDLN